MEIGKTKLALTASALAMALMLAGCGGSSSSGGASSAGGGSTPSTTSTQAELDVAKQQAADEKAAKEKAEKERDDLKKEKAAAEAEAERDAMNAAGKALKAALGNMPLAHLAGSNLGSTGLSVTVDDDGAGIGTGTTASPRMKAGASSGPLGDWAGKHYGHTNAGTKVSNSAVVYTNQAAPSVKPFATGATQDDGTAITSTTTAPTAEGQYQASSRTLALGTSASSSAIKGDMFPTAGTTTYTPDPVTNTVVVRGTYQGAPGSYRCAGAACTAEAESGSAITLGGNWFFVHDAGAMTSRADANYLYFGWWLQKDKDDKPTAASAFTGMVGDVDGNQTLADPTGLNGSATYAGHAAGKFAISDPINGGDAGHFTADATLTAKFGAAATADANNSNGLTGTLDNFMANGESVPWSVSLLRANLNGTGGTVAFNDPDTASVDESATQTVWSIDGNSAAASGNWSAQLYDEKPGPAPSGDGSDVATSVTGTFQSHFGSTHTMVGAFGATR